MKPFYLNNKLPELFLNQELTKYFLLPFNVAGALFSVETEKYKPVWITTSLLQLTDKEAYVTKKYVAKIEFLIANRILPGFTLENFKSWIEHSIIERNEVHANFSNHDYCDAITNLIELEYDPKFIPLYKSAGIISHVFFFLDPKTDDQVSTFSKLNELLEEIDRIKNVNKQLLETSMIPTLEVNTKLKIEYFNRAVEDLFPKLKQKKKLTFLEIWSSRNQTKILDTLYKNRNSVEEELIIFEEVDDLLKKLRIKFKLVSKTNKLHSNVLVTIENLNLENDKDKELTKKSFLLQSTQIFSYDLEDDETNFLQRSGTYILQNFELNGMYLLEFTTNQKSKYIVNFPKQKKEEISNSIFQAHLAHFNPILKRNVKHVLTNKVFNQELEYHYSIRKSTYLLGIPLYEGQTQLGVMVYLCDTKKIDLDSLYQLYSLTTLFAKIYNYQKKLSEIEIKV